MASSARLFISFFDTLSRHRIILYSLTCAILLTSVLVLKRITLTEDIRPMLPDRDPEVTADFSLLQKAPFLQKVLINLRVGPEAPVSDAIIAADRITQALVPPYFSRALSGPETIKPNEFYAWLTRSLPSLVSVEDITTMEGFINPEGVKKNLVDIFRRLQTPEGWAMKSLFQEDPLGFSAIGLEKLRSLSFLKGMKIEHNHFISADGRNVLIIAETPVPITDSKGARELVQYTQEVLDKNVSRDIGASFLSGHAYTSANAGTIQRDLLVILTCASAAILLLLLLFMRNWRALFVYLVPVSTVCIATAVTVLTYQTISAVTLAFGSVLMGISDDYPIFTYFSLRDKRHFAAGDVSTVSTPVLFSGVTTLATFSVLFSSGIPGQRQIAYFSVIGIIASLTFSLLVLPHLLRGMSKREQILPKWNRKASTPNRFPVIALWIIMMVVSIWQATHLSFNGDMRAVNLVPVTIKKTEQDLKETWGDFRQSAMAVSEGASLEEALDRNDRFYQYARVKAAPRQIVSLSPVLPSAKTQRANQERWISFWAEKRRKQLESLIVKEGNRVGFTPDAFAPFFSRLKGKGELITVDGLKKAGLSDLVDSFISREDGRYRILTLLPDTPDVVALFSAPNDELSGIRFISQHRFNEAISKVMVRSFVEYILIASLVMIAFLSVLFRNAKKVILALVPVATGLAFMFGMMGFFGIEFNIFNIIATILVIGLGVDLGIFMVSRVSEGVDRNTELAVTLSGLTSLVGLGALMLARHPSLHSIGITVFLGMCGTIPTAVLVVPALFQNRTLIMKSLKREEHP